MADPQALQLSRHRQLSRKVGHQATVSSHSSVLPSSSAQNWSPLTAASCRVFPSLCSRVATQPSEKIDACISFFSVRESLESEGTILCSAQVLLYVKKKGHESSLISIILVVFPRAWQQGLMWFLCSLILLLFTFSCQMHRKCPFVILTYSKGRWKLTLKNNGEIPIALSSRSGSRSEVLAARLVMPEPGAEMRKFSESLINHAEETPSAIGKHQHSSHSFVVANSRLVQASQTEF